MKVVRLEESSLHEVVAVLGAAFFEYPVMRYILKDAGDSYAEQLDALVTYFTRIRFVRDYPVLGVRSREKLVGVASLNPPRAVEASEVMKTLRRGLADAIGRTAMERFDAFAAACEPLEPKQPHYYLGMLGVPPEHQGEGHARRLLEHLHTMSASDPDSTGVVLTTEKESNLPFYRRFGYEILGEGHADDLVTWVMFRRDP